MLTSTDDLLDLCPGNRALMETDTYKAALREFAEKKSEGSDRPHFDAAISALHIRTNAPEARAGELSDEEWLREVMPTEAAVLLAAIQAEYDSHGVEPDPDLEITLFDSLEPVKVYADNGLPLRRELARHLLDQKRLNGLG